MSRNDRIVPSAPDGSHKVLASPSGRMSRGCCWMVMGELELEPDAELPEERLGG